MARLPLLDRDGLVDELDGIAADLEHLGAVRPITADAAARVDERRAILRRWQRDLTVQLAEIDPPPFTPVPLWRVSAGLLTMSDVKPKAIR